MTPPPPQRYTAVIEFTQPTDPTHEWVGRLGPWSVYPRAGTAEALYAVRTDTGEVRRPDGHGRLVLPGMLARSPGAHAPDVTVDLVLCVGADPFHPPPSPPPPPAVECNAAL